MDLSTKKGTDTLKLHFNVNILPIEGRKYAKRMVEEGVGSKEYNGVRKVG